MRTVVVEQMQGLVEILSQRKTIGILGKLKAVTAKRAIGEVIFVDNLRLVN